jgi:negative regulator of flagellin synthesis FlgM
MKIQGNSGPVPVDPSPSGKGKAKADKAGSGASASNVVGVATQISSLETQLADGGIDAAKIEALKDAIRGGQFQVNAGVVADKLIESVRELMSRKA